MTPFDLDQIGSGLPAARLLPELCDAVRQHSAAVVESPPGSGKTTVVPPALANLTTGRVVVAQPRRVAARAAARRLAALTGTPLGKLVGYTVRGDALRSPETRVEFVTDGVLVRRFLHSPDLPGVSAVVLDEVHERNIDSDLAFAFAQQVAQLRDDLAVVAMSATLDAERWAALLGEAPVLSVPMEPHPLAEHWAPFDGHRLDERGVRPEFLTHIVDTTTSALSAHPGQSALVFLPGHREVERVVARLTSRGVDALPLTGSLTAAQQDAALRPAANGQQRVVLATSVAESSLTVPDVRIVIDSGLAREPRLDRDRGMSGLVTVSESQDSGRQRAGRAARLGPGSVYRCLSPARWASFAATRKPEIAAVDLTETALLLALWGDPRADDLALPDRPPADSLAEAHRVLQSLGAITIDSSGAIAVTPRGRQLAEIPTHPRLARALLDAASVIGADEAAACVATLQSTQRAPGGDLAALHRQLRDGTDAASAQWRDERDRYRHLLHRASRTASSDTVDVDAASAAGSAHWRALTANRKLPSPLALAFVAATAYPERIARVRNSSEDSYLLAGGTGAQLQRDAVLRGQEWLVATDVTRGHAADGSGAQIRAALAIPRELAIEAAVAMHTVTVTTSFAGGRVTARQTERLGAIVLSETPIAPEHDAALECVRSAFAQQGPQLLVWSQAATQLRNRIAYVQRYLGDPWPEVSDAALRERGEQWLAPEFEQLANGAGLPSLDLVAALQRLLPWPEASRLGELAPERIEMPTGSRIRVEYPDSADADAPAHLAVKLQECFGLVSTPRLVDGRAPLVMHLLSPAQRPVAITEDLASFWRQGYPQVRAELRGRYSKHPWPEDPLTAPPQRGTKKSGR